MFVFTFAVEYTQLTKTLTVSPPASCNFSLSIFVSTEFLQVSSCRVPVVLRVVAYLVSCGGWVDGWVSFGIWLSTLSTGYITECRAFLRIGSVSSTLTEYVAQSFLLST